MPRISRVVLPGLPHHVTQRGVRSQDIFFEDEDRLTYLRHMREQTDLHGVRVLSYCLMRNHVHLILVPNDEKGLARAVGEAHRRYTLGINQRLEVRGYLFQGRFFSCPLDEEHLLVATRYVLRNPVRAGLVKEAAQWAWSSAAFHLGTQNSDGLVKRHDLCGLVTRPEHWKHLIEDERSSDEINANVIRGTTRVGRPLGNEEFVAKAERTLGRGLTPRKPGRPAKND